MEEKAQGKAGLETGVGRRRAAARVG